MDLGHLFLLNRTDAYFSYVSSVRLMQLISSKVIQPLTCSQTFANPRFEYAVIKRQGIEDSCFPFLFASKHEVCCLINKEFMP